MILNKEFLKGYGCCTEGYRYALSVGAIDNWTLDQAVEHCRTMGFSEFADDLEKQKKTELYVRMNGNIIMSEVYQVFNPLTGEHTQCESLEEAKTYISEVSNQLLLSHGVNLVKELRNDKGDAVWMPYSDKLNLNVSVEILN